LANLDTRRLLLRNRRLAVGFTGKERKNDGGGEPESQEEELRVKEES
jgi:hypothetical protein